MRQRALTPKETDALRHLRNRLVHGGKPPSVRELMEVLGYRSPRSAAEVLRRLTALGFVNRRGDGRLQLLKDLPEHDAHARTVSVPLVGAAPCGAPLLAEQNIQATIPVSTRLAKPSHRYFFLRADGDSMNKAGIEDGDLMLVQQQVTAENGDRVVALIDDEATVKVLRRGLGAIILEPRSTNKAHKPILVTSDFQIQGVVVATVRDWEKG